jgi:precorrin-6A synthase
MKQVFIIGIGPGHPDQLTVQAVDALNRVDVIFVMDKGEGAEELVRLRREICERHIRDRSYRFVDVPDPARDRSAPRYEEAVADWHRRRADRLAVALGSELRDGERGAFLVWGDPSLYDSTLRVADLLAERAGSELVFDVIPGVSSVQALAASHRLPLNRVGESIHITTGRLLRAGLPAGIDNVVVMLDGDCSFTTIPEPADFDIYWGAYLGTDDQILIAGNLADRMAEVQRVRAEARAARGWIMDVYLLRRRTGARDEP